MDVMEERRTRLLRILREKSYIYRSDPPFRLVSGRLSKHYINCKPTTKNAEGMHLVGEILYDLVKDLGAAALGGLTMGADPIAHAVSMISFARGNPISSFSVRKQSKEHGTAQAVEGDVRRGDPVIIVDDVITTGSSTIRAIEAAKEFGLEIVQVIALVDREEGGRENIEKHIEDFRSVFTLSEIKRMPDQDHGGSIRTTHQAW